MTETKTCIACKEEKNENEFLSYKFCNKCDDCIKKGKRDYRNSEQTKEREKKAFIKRFYKRTYGISIEEYQEMLVNQNYLCAICKSDKNRINPKSKKKENLSVDHCHKTGKIRGLLCSKCNQGLGFFNDNPEIMKSALDYLLKSVAGELITDDLYKAMEITCEDFKKSLIEKLELHIKETYLEYLKEQEQK